MPTPHTVRRGRKPSIGTATDRVRNFRRTLKALVTELGRLETRLDDLDRYYSRLARQEQPAAAVGRPTLRGRGPNVRDTAFEILRTSKHALPIVKLAERVKKVKGGSSGKAFVQNLGAALAKDKRFRRVERGVYGLR